MPAPTERLAFRSWNEADLPLAEALFGDPRVTALVGGPLDARARLAAEIASEREHGFQYWPVFRHDGTHVGCCGLKPKHPSVPELGFYFLPAFWGRGFATEAGASVIAFAWQIGAEALFAGHHPDNHASRRALEKLGFGYTHHELYPPTGLEHPGYRLVR